MDGNSLFLYRPNYQFFPSWIGFSILFKKSLSTPSVPSCYPTFHLKALLFCISHFYLQSIWNWFVYMMWGRVQDKFFRATIELIWYHDFSFVCLFVSNVLQCHSAHKLGDCVCVGLVGNFLFFPLSQFLCPMPISQCLTYYKFLGLDTCERSLSYVLLLQDYLGYSFGPLHSHLEI